MKSVLRGLGILFVFWCLAFSSGINVANAQDDSPSRLTLDTLDYQLRDIERRAAQSKGSPFQLGAKDLETLEKIRDMAKQFPNHERVASLVERARKAYQASRGETFQITEAMVAFRQREQNLTTAAAEEAKREWTSLLENVKKSQDAPIRGAALPDPLEVGPDALNDTFVTVSVESVAALFVQNGKNWLAAGSASSGFVYVDASSRSYAALFESLQRFRRTVAADVGTNWEILGTIDGVHLLVPGEGEEGIGPAYLGWVLQPTAIHVPEQTLAVLTGDTTGDARYAGEERIQKIIKETFTVTSVDPNAAPADIVRTYITALKEKNWDVVLLCIDPSQRETEAQRTTLRFYYDQNLKGLAQFHVHGEPAKAEEIVVLRGQSSRQAQLDDFFGDKERSAPDAPLLEEVKVWVKLYNERGVQSALPRPVTLRREGGSQWFIYSGIGLTF